MFTVKCKSCGLPLPSSLTEDQILEALQEENPDLQEVTILCRLCMAVEEAANPDITIYRPEDDSEV